ncbi:MAG: SpoIIE family protein phosphatase [Pseudomonadales bacterium]|nr:SpoIIE family protein phosphatase [Pseudomonadales bacterium]
MNVGNEELLVLSEADSSGNNTLSALVHPLEASGYSVHIARPENCLDAIKQYSPNVVLLPLSNLSDTSDFADLLTCIQAQDNELSVIILAPESLVEPHALADSQSLITSPADNVIPLKSFQVQALLEQGIEDVVIGSTMSDLTIVIIKRAIEHAIEKKQQQQLIMENQQLTKENQALRLLTKTFEQDVQAGVEVVSQMSPETPLNLGSFKFDYTCRPCLEVGGDSVNYFQLKDGRIVFYFADVSGHGIAAAIVTSALMSLKNPFIDACEFQKLQFPSEMLSWFNEALIPQGFGQHITMFLGVIDETNMSFQYSNAAHFPSVLLHSNGAVRFLELQGLPLAMCTAKYESRQVEITKSFDLVMFSDGVLEIMQRTSLADKEKDLLELVECGHRDVDSLCDQLGINDHCAFPDDIALLTITYLR